MWSRWHRVCVASLAAMWLVATAGANPVRRSSGELEARRRSAIDRGLIRFGRSPPEVTAADIREAFQRPARRNNNFLRFGRSQPLTFSTDDLIALLRAYNDEEEPTKRASNFVRLGRDPKFIRLGRSPDEEKPNTEQGVDLVLNGYPQRKSRARDHFLRLGRDSEEMNESEDEEGEDRKKRAAETCSDCHT